MITLKSAREIETMAESGALLADVHKNLRDFIKPGVTSWDIEVFVRNYIESMVGLRLKLDLKAMSMRLVLASMTKFVMDFHVKNR